VCGTELERHVYMMVYPVFFDCPRDPGLGPREWDKSCRSGEGGVLVEAARGRRTFL
jgi:hypothetical protein